MTMNDSTSSRLSRDAPLFIPPLIKIGYERTGVLGLSKRNVADEIPALRSKALYVVGEPGLATPFGFRPLPVSGWRLPALSVRLVTRQVRFHPLAAPVVLVGRRPTKCAELKDMAVAVLRGRPLQPAIDDEDRATRFQTLLEKALVSLPQRELLEAEVGHVLDHQAVPDSDRTNDGAERRD